MDLLNICRICSSEKNNTKNIYQAKLCTETILLCEAFSFVTNIKISEDDGLPKVLCTLCTRRLLDAYRLKRQAEESNELFSNRLKNNICNVGQEEVINYGSGDKWKKEETLDGEYINLSEEYMKKEEFLVDIDELEMLISYEEDSPNEHGIRLLPKLRSRKGNYLRSSSTASGVSQKNPTQCTRPKHRCQVCSREFSRKSNLVDHLRLHANLKLFQCKYCDKSFVQIANYRTHMRIHTNERPFQCHLCTKSYNQSSSLKIHIRSHTDERNYSCDHCGKAFTNSSDLKKHKRVHDPNMQFTCDICQKLFAQKVNMLSHKRRLHSCKTEC